MQCQDGCLAVFSQRPSRAVSRLKLRGTLPEESHLGRVPAVDESLAEAARSTEELRRLVQDGLVDQMAEMRSALSGELQGMIARLDSLGDGSRTPSVQDGAAPPRRASEVHARPLMRRWTLPEQTSRRLLAVDLTSVRAALDTVGGRPSITDSEFSLTPGATSSCRSASGGSGDEAQSEAGESRHTQKTNSNNSKRGSVRFESIESPVGRSPSQLRMFDSEESGASASSAAEAGAAHRERRPSRSSLRAHLTFEVPRAEPCEAGEADEAPERPTGGSGPSKWRANALDVGDKLASSAAARQGGASVDSIVDLVEAERELRAEERLALEARLEELREQQKLRLAQEGGGAGADPEKESLRKQVQELRGVIKARSRFGAWVCERHMQESDDEDDDGPVRNSDKEFLREQLTRLEKDIKAARRQREA